MVEYLVNYHYIATELCVNKDKPELKCDGKCHLKSQLAKAASDDTSTNHKSKSSAVEVLVFFQEILTFGFQIKAANFTTTNHHYSNLYSMAFDESSFHPPTVSV